MGKILCTCHQKWPQYKKSHLSNIDLLIWLKKKRGIQKGEEKNENILKMPLFTSLINQQDLVFTKKQSQLLKKEWKRGRINDICYFGCFLKNSKITQSKVEHITKICQKWKLREPLTQLTIVTRLLPKPTLKPTLCGKISLNQDPQPSTS